MGLRSLCVLLALAHLCACVDNTQSRAITSSLPWPHFDGILLFNGSAIAESSTDSGYLVETPLAVLQPASYQDVQKLILFANDYNISVSARGRGHCTAGQDLLQGGVIVQMSNLSAIFEVDYQSEPFPSITVQAGASWGDVIQAAYNNGLVPPIVIGSTDPTVGGSLSIGGVGDTSWIYGYQVDYVLELLVVTGTGELLNCSNSVNSDVFNSVLAGLSQFGIIVQAKIGLVSFLPLTRLYILQYFDFTTFYNEHHRLVENATLHRFKHLQGRIYQYGNNVQYQLVAAIEFDDLVAPPNDTQIISGLQGNLFWNTTLSTLHFITGSWSAPSSLLLHPVFQDFFYVFNTIEKNDVGSNPSSPELASVFYYPNIDSNLGLDYGQNLFRSTSNITSFSLYLFYCLSYNTSRQRYMRLPSYRPNNSSYYDFYTVVAPNVSTDENQALLKIIQSDYDNNLIANGGVDYPSDSVFQRQWCKELSNQWDNFVQSKKTYDPNHLLAKGVGVNYSCSLLHNN